MITALPREIEPRHQPALPALYYQRSSAFGYAQTVPPLALMAACLTAIGTVPARWVPVAAAAAAMVAYRLTFVVHDSSHRTLFRRRWENEWAGWIAASLLLVSFPMYRRLHWIHHLHVRTADDPQGADYNGLVPGRDRVLWHLVKPLVGGAVLEKAVAFFAIQHAGMTKGERASIAEQPRVAPADLAAILSAQAVVFWLTTAGLARPLGYGAYLLSLVTLGLFVSRVRSYLEHGSLLPDHESLSVARTHPSNWVERNVLSGLNFNFHNEHHRWPQVPSRHLPAVHRSLTAALLQPHEYSPSYWASLRQIARAARRRPNAAS